MALVALVMVWGGMGSGAGQALAGTNQIKVRDLFYTTSQPVIVYIHVKNEDAFKGFQFDLTLPAGLSFDGVSAALTSARRVDHSLVWNSLGNNTWRFIGYSLSNATIPGTSGNLVAITCTAPGGLGSYALSLSGVRLVYVSGSPETTVAGGTITIYSGQARLRVRTRLEGWNRSGSMTNTLAMDGYIPLASPYAEAPRTAASIPTTIADWIQLDLLLTTTGLPVFSQSYFIGQDGNLYELNGTTYDLVLGVPAGSYWIVLRHRNHSAVMSAAAVTLNTTTYYLYDFTLAASQYYGSGGTLSIGRYVMPAGDINQDGYLTTKDQVLWYNKKFSSPAEGYHAEDLNGDGLVTDADFTLWQTNARAGLDSRVR
jgi:hypothetical protein